MVAPCAPGLSPVVLKHWGQFGEPSIRRRAQVRGGAPPGRGKGVGAGDGAPDKEGLAPDESMGDRLAWMTPAMIVATANTASTRKAVQPRVPRPF